MSFDYSYTCPQIDSQIDKVKKGIFDYLYDIAYDYRPDLDEKGREVWAEAQTDILYRDMEGYFETVRNLNDEMRREANTQIETLEDKVALLEEENRELRS